MIKKQSKQRLNKDRPNVYFSIMVRFKGEMQHALANRVVQYADKHDVSRARAIRHLITLGLDSISK